MSRRTTNSIIAQTTDLATWEQELTLFNHSIFLLPQWLQIIETPSRKAIYIDFIQNNVTISKISGLLVSENKLMGKMLFFYAAPAFRSKVTEDTYHHCLYALVALAKKNNISRIQILYFDQRNSLLPPNGYFHSHQMHEAIFDLKNEFTSFKPGSSLRKKRNQALRAQTSWFISNDPQQLPLLSELAENTLQRRKNKHNSDYKKLELPFFTEQHLPKLLESGLGKMYCSMNPDGQSHFISVIIEYNGTAYGLFNGCDEFGYDNGLPGYILLNASQDLFERGIERLNMGGTPAISNEKKKLLQFKEELGAKPQAFYITKTDFLVFPQKILNPLINIGRKLPYNTLSKSFSQWMRH